VRVLKALGWWLLVWVVGSITVWSLGGLVAVLVGSLGVEPTMVEAVATVAAGPLGLLAGVVVFVRVLRASPKLPKRPFGATRAAVTSNRHAPVACPVPAVPTVAHPARGARRDQTTAVSPRPGRTVG